MRPRRLIELLSLLLLVTACRSAPTTRYYVLAPSNTAPETEATSTGEPGLRIGVEPFTVDPPYDRDQLVYRLGVDSVEVGFYSYHRWAAPLSELVAVAMAEGLRGAPGIGSIEPWTSGGEYDALLHGRVLYLEEIDVPGQQEARLRLELRLVDLEGSMIWSQEVFGSAAGQSDTVAQIVEQLYVAFDQALEQARAGLTRANL